MSAATDDIEEIRKHTKVYLMVFAVLGVLTVVTVAVAYLDLPPAQAITVALIIASIKASLVALYFMHLISEKKAIYSVLALTGVFFVAAMLLPVFTTEESVTRPPLIEIPAAQGHPHEHGGGH